MAAASAWRMYESLLQADPATWNPAECLLVAFGQLRDEVNQGGFHAYFCNYAGDLALVAIDASVEAGLNELADLVRRAVDTLGSPYPVDHDERQQRLDEIEPDAFENFYEQFRDLELSRDLDGAMDRLAART